MLDNSPILDVRDVRRSFGGLAAVDGVTFAVERGSITGLIGPNGAGKTTLFNIINGVYKPDEGEIFFEGRRIDGKPRHVIAASGLVRTFQLPKALTRMSVLDNVMLAGQRNPGESLIGRVVRPRAARIREREIRERATELVALVGLERLIHAYAGTLSGGQRKLLEFARAVMADPSLVMLDEPMAGVNATLGLKLLEHMEHLRRERGTTFVVIEHDMEVIMSVSDTITVMNAGRVISSGTAAEVSNDQQVIDAYLGAHPEPEAELAEVWNHD